MRSITVPADIIARFEALEAAVAALRDVKFEALDSVVRCQMLQHLETSRREQSVLSHDIIGGLATEDRVRLGGPAYQVIADWCRISYAEARRRIFDAAQLAPRVTPAGTTLPPVLPATAEAWRRGQLDAQHLRVIQGFIRDLPGDTPAAVRDEAEEYLAGEAARQRPDQLDRAAKRKAKDLNPDNEYSDEDRARRRGFSWRAQRTDGMSVGTLIATPELRAKIDTWLARFAAPGMCNPADQTPCLDSEPAEQAVSGDNRTYQQRQHDALNALVTGHPGHPELGHHNGLPVSVVVSTTLQDLTAAAGTGVTASGTLIPMRELIAMAGQAIHYLAVFDQHSERPLYLGRSRRIASADQRIVLYSSERGCTFPGCDVTADKCEVHHTRPWATDGNTNIDELTLSCGPHHKLTEKGWQTSKLPNHRTAWIPPPHLDTGQPRTNDYHHPERRFTDDHDERAGP